jgi:hypothetical protein
MVGWRPADTDHYNMQLSDKLKDIDTSTKLDFTADAIEHKLTVLENQVRKTADLCKAVERRIGNRFMLAPDTHALMDKRRAPQADAAAAPDIGKAALSKLIQRHIRRDIRKHKKERIAEKISKFRDLKMVSGIRKRGKRKNLSSVVDSSGQVKTSQQEIVDVFADLYADLYAQRAPILLTRRFSAARLRYLILLLVKSRSNSRI